MHGFIRGKLKKIGGQIPTAPDRIVQTPSGEGPTAGAPISFRDLARMAWPDKTESHLAFITRVDPRTCRRWLAGDNEPPAEVLGVILCEIMRRYSQRA